jgi:hypothetical protein
MRDTADKRGVGIPRPMKEWATALLFGLLLSSAHDPAHADASEPVVAVNAVRVAASERYKANRVHRFALGGG